MNFQFQAILKAGALLRRARCAPLLALAILCLLPARVLAQSSQSEYAVKGAFLYNFAKFVQWPSNAFAEPSSPVVIGIFGHDPSGGEIEATIGSKMLDGRKVVVRVVSTIREAAGVQILFVPASSMGRVGELAQLKNAPTLVVGETENFAHRYGDVGFIPDGARLAFEINASAAKTSGLTISSKLLRLAKWVG